jgi:glycosyltransferase involved in cell wall biosynthesis
MSDACGCLVPPRDPAALANALASVLKRTWNAPAISGQWSRGWETVVAELMTIFESVMSKERVAAHGR